MALMTLLWGMNYAAGKLVTVAFPALLGSGLRFTVAALVILPIYLWAKRNSGWLPERSAKRALQLLAVGTAGLGANQYFFLAGIEHTSVGHAAVIFTLYPVLVLLIAVAIGQERFTRAKVAGLALATLGVALLQLEPERRQGASLAGDVLVFMGGLAFAAYTVVGKGLIRRVDGLTMNTFALAGCAIVFLPLSFWLSDTSKLFSPEAAVSWAAVLYMALGASVFCLLVYYEALRYFSASRVSALGYLQPLIAITTAIPLFGEQATGWVLAGGVLVLAGVFLAERG
jgi:drug/metabolite transporter (DMT)-like permease